MIFTTKIVLNNAGAAGRLLRPTAINIAVAGKKAANPKKKINAIMAPKSDWVANVYGMAGDIYNICPCAIPDAVAIAGAVFGRPLSVSDSPL